MALTTVLRTNVLHCDWSNSTSTLSGTGCASYMRVVNPTCIATSPRFAPRSTQPSIPPGSVNEYQLRLGRQRQVWLIQTADERVGVQVKLWNPLRTRVIPERFCGCDSLRRGAISSVCTFTFYLCCISRPWRDVYDAIHRCLQYALSTVKSEISATETSLHTIR